MAGMYVSPKKFSLHYVLFIEMGVNPKSWALQSRQILGGAKKKSEDSFAEAQKTGKETTGQAASAGDAQPAISQVDPSAPEASDSIGDSIAAKADVSLHFPL
jgi:hypothetical protein